MGRPKGSKNKSKAKAAKDPNVEDMYETEIEFNCPVRGLIKQKVKVRKFKPLSVDQQRQLIDVTDSLSDIEEKDDGLSIYNEDDVSED